MLGRPGAVAGLGRPRRRVVDTRRNGTTRAALGPRAGRAPEQVPRCAPYLGDRHIDHGDLRSHARSRLARWRAVQLSSVEFARALAYECLVLRRNGYPDRLVRVAWTKAAGDHVEGARVRPLLASVL